MPVQMVQHVRLALQNSGGIKQILNAQRVWQIVMPAQMAQHARLVLLNSSGTQQILNVLHVWQIVMLVQTLLLVINAKLRSFLM